MQIFLLVLIFAVLGGLLILPSRPCRDEVPPEPEPVSIDWETVTAALSVPLDALRELMEHPQLGGPGFLTVQFPLSSRGAVEVSAQYPNIQETLYRKIRTAKTEELLVMGVPAALLDCRAVFTPESGGMVLVTAEIDLPETVLHLLEDRQGRQEVLQELVKTLGEQYPDMTVRAIGGDLLLTPIAHFGDT